MFMPKPLSIRTTREGAVHRLTPIGELDIATAPLLETAFEAVLEDDDAGMIVVDLTELSFMDSTGIHLLVRMQAACADADRLRVINGSPAVERILDLSGVRAHLPIVSGDRDPLVRLDDTSDPCAPMSRRRPEPRSSRDPARPDS
ncbi:MAG TPA: STAS domain-containing protein [Solirubrobacteraceae bacterium]|nr:STAS domain-containing protein [Solirubrobacteraceae bacterium]